MEEVAKPQTCNAHQQHLLSNIQQRLASLLHSNEAAELRVSRLSGHAFRDPLTISDCPAGIYIVCCDTNLVGTIIQHRTRTELQGWCSVYLCFRVESSGL